MSPVMYEQLMCSPPHCIPPQIRGKIKFITDHQQEYPITTLCRVLQVAVSGDSAWKKRTPRRRRRKDAVLSERIRRIYDSNRQVYGSPRIHAVLHARSAKLAGKSAWRGCGLIPICILMDKFEWQETHVYAEQCYLLERELVSERVCKVLKSCFVPGERA
jgi:hypothetical protein